MSLSFWSNYWKSAPGRYARFYSVQIQIPEKSNGNLHQTSKGNLDLVAPFLKTYFKSNTRSPEYNYEKVQDEILLQIQDMSGAIAGSIRARPAGSFEYMPISLIDCFCVRPDMKRKGLGTSLLLSIKKECTASGIYNAIFLKEGNPINVPGVFPIYSSFYAYRHISGLDKSISVSYMSASQAYAVISSYSLLRPDTFLIINKRTDNQRWLMYRHSGSSTSIDARNSGPGSWVLALIQNSYQTISGKKIAWVTGWIESPLVNEDTRILASEAITSSITRLGYDWVWLDYNWVGKSKKFQFDGPFHWYTYQWATSVTPNISYCIMS